MYTDINFKSGKAVKDAFKAGQQIGVHQPGGFFASQTDGEVTIEGPHYPQAHSWYLRVRIEDGIIVAVKDGSKWIKNVAVVA